MIIGVDKENDKWPYMNYRGLLYSRLFFVSAIFCIMFGIPDSYSSPTRRHSRMRNMRWLSWILSISCRKEPVCWSNRNLRGALRTGRQNTNDYSRFRVSLVHKLARQKTGSIRFSLSFDGVQGFVGFTLQPTCSSSCKKKHDGDYTPIRTMSMARTTILCDIVNRVRKI